MEKYNKTVRRCLLTKKQMPLGVVFYLCSICLLTGLQDVSAQDFFHSQFYASPLSLNPSLAGNIECSRLGISYRNQWMSIPNAYSTYNLSYDQSFSNLKSGLGLLVSSDQQAENLLSSTQLSGIYSYRFNLTEFSVVSLGLQGSYFNNVLHSDKLIFPKDILENGIVLPSSESGIVDGPISFFDFSMGMAFDFNSIFFGGLALHHLNNPNNAYYRDVDNNLPTKVTIHGGSYFSVYQDMEREIFLSPNFMYQQQKQFRQLNLGMYVDVAPFVGGVWLRHNFAHPDAVVFLVGLQKNRLNIGYSYDLTLSHLSMFSGGAHELTCSYKFCFNVEKRRVVRAIKCPDF